MATFPTLLTSRPRHLGEEKVPSPQPAPEPLKTRLPEAYPYTVCVRNTFIDTAEQRSPSLDAFYREREVLTCPGSKVGQLRGLFREQPGAAGQEQASPRFAPAKPPPAPAGAGHAAGVRPRAAPPAPTPMPGRQGGSGRSRVLKLAEALGTPAALARQPPLVAPIVAVDGQACPWGTCPALTLAHDVPCVPTPASGGLEGYSGAQCYAQPELSVQVLEGTYAMEQAAPAPGGRLRPPALGVPEPPAPPAGPAPGSAELPSLGSAEHASGQCKPCAFVHTVGCSNALTCQFCHLCEPGERKRRRREKLELRRAEQRGRAPTRTGEQA